MIFEKIKKAKSTEERFKETVIGVIEYKQKILRSLNDNKIHDLEIPFILAALKLVAEDIEAIINRKPTEEKEQAYRCCEDVCEMCRLAILTATVQKKAKGD